MAGKIRGITIELSGDTKGLVKSLNSAKSAVKGVQTQLRDVNKVLKLDPKNTELLTQKQNLLKEQVEETKNALEKQKQALQDMQNAEDSDKTIEAQNALQREIAETEAKLKEAEAELKNFGSVGAQQFAQVGESVKQAGEKMAGIGDQLTKKVTAPIVALGGLAVKSFKDVDAGLDIIVQKTGATGEAFEEMEGIFKNIARTVPAEFEQIGSAVGEVNTRFGATGEALEELSTQFIQFAQLQGQDVSMAIDQSQKALFAFGLGAESAGAFLDTMNYVTQQTGVTAEKLQAGLISNATAFQELGLSIDQSTMFMGMLEKSGANSETVLNGLRKALKNATAEGKPLDEALSDLEETIMNGTDGMDGLTASYELFGKSGDQIYGAIKNGTLSFKDLAQASIDAGGSVASTFEATLDPVDQFKLTMQGLQVTGAEVGNTLLTILAPAFEKIGTAVQSLGEWWSGLSPQMQDTIVKIGMIVAVIGPLLATGGRLLIGIGQLMTFAPAIIGGITTIGGVITGTMIPALVSVVTAIAPIAIAIGAVIAVGVLLYKHWDEISAKAIEIWGNLKEWFSTTLEAIKTKFSEIWEGIKTTVSTIWDGIKEKITTVINAIKTTISTVFNAIKAFITSVVNGWKIIITTAWNTIKSVVSGVINGIRTNVSNVFNGIKNTISNVFNSIKTIASNVWNGIKNAITNPIQTAKNTVSNIISKIKGLFPLSVGKIFSGFKLPHVEWSWKDVGGVVKIPSFSVSWYKRGAEEGAMFNRESIFGYQNGKFLGGGDATQPEMLIGKNTLLNMISGAVASGMGGDAIYSAVVAGMQDANIQLFIDGKEVTSAVNRRNTFAQRSRWRSQGI